MENSITQLRSVTCHMGSHSVTCYPTQVNAPRLQPSRTGWYVLGDNGFLILHCTIYQILTSDGPSDSLEIYSNRLPALVKFMTWNKAVEGTGVQEWLCLSWQRFSGNEASMVTRRLICDRRRGGIQAGTCCDVIGRRKSSLINNKSAATTKNVAQRGSSQRSTASYSLYCRRVPSSYDPINTFYIDIYIYLLTCLLLLSQL